MMFLRFRSYMTRDALSHPAAVTHLLKMALSLSQAAERAAKNNAIQSWISWIQEGPGAGLRRQHRMTRNATGWHPTAVETGDEAALSLQHLPSALRQDPSAVPPESGKRCAPRTAQQAADAEAASWAKQWLADEPGLADNRQQMLTWREHMGPILARMTLPGLKQALATFAADTGLGWDAVHPRALLRLPDSSLLALLRILFVCECRGAWPSFVSMVLIVLIPKSDGGRRPIGLLPLFPRIWMRLRHDVIQQWEQSSAVHREYFYAGPARGAHVATWRQGFRAELARMKKESYAQALLDLVKAFERVPWHVLVREGIQMGYPFVAPTPVNRHVPTGARGTCGHRRVLIGFPAPGHRGGLRQRHGGAQVGHDSDH